MDKITKDLALNLAKLLSEEDQLFKDFILSYIDDNYNGKYYVSERQIHFAKHGSIATIKHSLKDEKLSNEEVKRIINHVKNDESLAEIYKCKALINKLKPKLDNFKNKYKYIFC